MSSDLLLSKTSTSGLRLNKIETGNELAINKEGRAMAEKESAGKRKELSIVKIKPAKDYTTTERKKKPKQL